MHETPAEDRGRQPGEGNVFLPELRDEDDIGLPGFAERAEKKAGIAEPEFFPGGYAAFDHLGAVRPQPLPEHGVPGIARVVGAEEADFHAKHLTSRP